MKVSKEEKQKTHRRIVDAAVEVISSRGFRDATMHEIAQRARVGDATIYKYFPTKEQLLFAYFELRKDDLIERLRAVPDFHQYSFREQFHVLLETNLELFEADRPFIRIAYKDVFLKNWIATAAGAKPLRERFVTIVDDLVTASVEAGEFEEPPFKTFFYELLWEYAIGITCYWLEDESPRYASTTQLIDKTLAILDALLRSRLLNIAVDLAQFLVREHLLAKLQTREGPEDARSLRPKRPFMAAAHNGPAEPRPQATPLRRGRTAGRPRRQREQ